MTKIESIFKTLGQSILNYFPKNQKGELKEEDIQNVEDINKFLSISVDSYVVVEWPEIQELMEEEWFSEEAILNWGGSASSYFIPIKRLL